MKKIKILGIQFDALIRQEAIAHIMHALVERPGEGAKQIVTANPEMLLEAQRNDVFRAVLNRAWLSVADGIGILWAATVQNETRHLTGFRKKIHALWLLGALFYRPSRCQTVIPRRVSGVDLMLELCKEAADKNFSIFLLGGAEGVSGKTARILEDKCAGIKITGVFSGSPYEDDLEIIKEKINAAAPAILFVAFGSPSQELWIAKNLYLFPTVRIAMGVGGAFDMIAGKRKRAPAFMQKIGLEWLARLVQEPRRIKRIYAAVIRFPLAVLKQ